MRILFPLFLLLAGMAWFVYAFFIQKNTKLAKNIVSVSLFFGVIWGLIYYFLFR